MNFNSYEDCVNGGGGAVCDQVDARLDELEGDDGISCFNHNYVTTKRGINDAALYILQTYSSARLRLRRYLSLQTSTGKKLCIKPCNIA